MPGRLQEFLNKRGCLIVIIVLVIILVVILIKQREYYDPAVIGKLTVAENIKTTDYPLNYETETLNYIVPERKAKYTPDFVFTKKDGTLMYIETKGRWTSADRLKMKHVLHSNPGIDIRLVFQAPTQKISKASKTTYEDYAVKLGIKHIAKKTIPYPVHFKSGYYSFGLLCLYCYVSRTTNPHPHSSSDHDHDDGQSRNEQRQKILDPEYSSDESIVFKNRFKIKPKQKYNNKNVFMFNQNAGHSPKAAELKEAYDKIMNLYIDSISHAFI